MPQKNIHPLPMVKEKKMNGRKNKKPDHPVTPVTDIDIDFIDGYYFSSQAKIEKDNTEPTSSKRKREDGHSNNSQAKILQKLPTAKRQKTDKPTPTEQSRPEPRPTLARAAKDRAKTAIYLTPIQYGHFKTPVAEPVSHSTVTLNTPRKATS